MSQELQEDTSTQSSQGQAPSLPAFPSFSDLSSLSASLDTVSTGDNDSPSAVWGSAAAVTTPVLAPARSHSPNPPPASTSRGSVESAIAAQASHAALLADLDPYAPSNPFADQVSLGLGTATPPTFTSTRTLGERVTPTSKLELMTDSDASSSPSPSPTSSFAAIGLPIQQDEAPQLPDKSAASVGQGQGPSGSFFGGMFRSFSGSPSVATHTEPVPSQAEQEKSTLQKDFNEKAPPPLPASSAEPIASTSTSNPQPQQPPSSSNSSLPNPIATIASVFRSATSSRPTSQAGTPPVASSPVQNEKGAYMEAGRKAKEKEKEDQPQEEVGFDFNKFLEQMRSRNADPIAKYLRSFLKEFSRRPPASTNDQIKVVNDFLDFIAGKMRTVDPWKSLLAESTPDRGEAEFDMAMEAMEKLVMNRVWHLTFAPAVDLNTIPGHLPPSDDLERDHVLTQRIRLFSWIEPIHLDLPINPPPSLPASPNPNIGSLAMSSPAASSDGSDNEGGGEKAALSVKKQQKQTQGFLDFAERELAKINQYKAPRDKLICVLNSCKVIFGLIRHVSTEEGADAFIPFLIYVVLKANPEHLVSNLQYIQRFRNPEKLSGEGGYYLSSLNGAISFIETMDASSLSNITQAEFENNVELAIQRLPVDPQDSTLRLPRTPTKTTFSRNANSPEPPHSTAADLTQATDTESPALIQQPGLSLPNATKAFFIRSSDSVERIVSKPLGAIARVFDQIEQLAGDGEVSTGRLQPPPNALNGTPQPPESGNVPVRRRSYAPYRQGQARPPPLDIGATQQNQTDPGLFLSDRMEQMSPGQVSEEIERVTEEKRLASIETLRSIFPQLESEVLEMVLLSNGGEMGTTVEALLEMSTS